MRSRTASGFCCTNILQIDSKDSEHREDQIRKLLAKWKEEKKFCEEKGSFTGKKFVSKVRAKKTWKH